MARCTAILLTFLALVPLYYTLDCRKFSFAPACRGIMLKRSGAHAIVGQAQPLVDDAKIREAQMMEYLVRAIEEDALIANSDCVSMSWLRDRLINAKNDFTMN